MSVQIDDAREDECGAIADLARACGLASWSSSAEVAWERQIFGGAVRVARDGGHQVLGFSIFRTVADQSELLGLAVEPMVRRRGLGRRLIVDWLEQSQVRGAVRLLLEVRATNHAALGLYQSFEFAEVGRRRGYYRDGQAAVLMERIVTPPA